MFNNLYKPYSGHDLNFIDLLKVHKSMQKIANLNFTQKIYWGIFVAISLLLLLRSLALNPTIFADEYTYSMSSRLQPLEISAISNYLYLAIFRFTNLCGPNYLGCVKVFNFTFFILALPFVYAVARRVTSKNTAMLIVVLTLMAPINIYIAYFIPEPMYFLFFWIYAWFILGLSKDSKAISWFITGLLIGLGSIIKTHALFLIPPTLIFLLYLLIGLSIKEVMKYFLIGALSIVVGALLAKFGLSYLLVGKAGMTIFGHTYGATATDFSAAVSKSIVGASEVGEPLQNGAKGGLGAISLASQFLPLMQYWLINFVGHLIALVILFSLSLAVGIKQLMPMQGNAKTLLMQKKYIFFALITCVTLIFISSLFSAFVKLSSNGEIYRLHLRYYNFLFPLFLIILYAAFEDGVAAFQDHKYRVGRLLIACAIFAALIYALMSNFDPYQPAAIDSPELMGIFFIKKFFIFFILSSAILILMWIFQEQLAIHITAYGLIPLMIIVGAIGVNKNLFFSTDLNVYDKAGIMMKQYLSADELSRLIVVGDNHIELSRTLFYLDNAKIAKEIVSGGVEVTPAILPPGKNLALIFDGHPISEDFINQIHFNGFSLVGGHGDLSIDFTNSVGKRIDGINYIKGIFEPRESWGIWSVEKEVVIQFQKALPEKFTLSLNARAYAQNANKVFTVYAGRDAQTFKLNNTFSWTSLEINNPSHSNTLRIMVPKPVSPKSLGESEDDRLLGIGIREMKLSW